MTYNNKKYTIDITTDDTYTIDSADNRTYDYVMNPQNLARSDFYKTLCISVTGIKNINIALICDYYSPQCALLEEEILTVLLNNYVAQIDLDAIKIVGGYPIDIVGTSFAIYRLTDGYLIYGEIEILKLDNDFNVLWRFSGKDIFVSISGKSTFELTDHSIKLYDFEDNFYELDFDGKLIN